MGFTRDAVERLSALRDEPAWLHARRLESFEVYDRTPMPDTRRDADWRQVDLKGLDLQAFEAFQQPDGRAPAPVIPGTAAVLAQRGTGSTSTGAISAELKAKGVVFLPLWQAVLQHPELVERHLFSALKPDRDKFAALHAAFFSGGTFLYVPDGVTLDRPLVGQFWSAGTGGSTLPHTVIVAGKGARVQYLDEFLSPKDDPASVASGSSEIFLGDGANVVYVALHRWGERAWQFANQRIRLGRDAQFQGVNVGLGGRFARLRMEALLEGEGSTAQLRGLFFGTGQQAFDFRTLQDHLAPHTTSDLLYKGALRDLARSVYVGVVRVEKNARGTSANQANRNLLLSEKARATSEPILEIENNDIVRCSHGATVGPVDSEHLFYLTSRGIPRSIAQRMLVQGFLSEVLDKIPVAYARQVVEEELARRLD